MTLLKITSNRWPINCWKSLPSLRKLRGWHLETQVMTNRPSRQLEKLGVIFIIAGSSCTASTITDCSARLASLAMSFIRGITSWRLQRHKTYYKSTLGKTRRFLSRRPPIFLDSATTGRSCLRSLKTATQHRSEH